MITFCYTQLHTVFPHLFICFLLISCVVIYHQAVVSVSSSVQGVQRLGVVANTGLFGNCTVKGPVLLCLDTHTHTHINELLNTFSQLLRELLYKYKLSYLSHGRLSNLVRVFSDAFQKVLEVWHGDLLDLLSEFGQVFSHNLTEPVLTDPTGGTAQVQLCPKKVLLKSNHHHLICYALQQLEMNQIQ